MPDRRFQLLIDALINLLLILPFLITRYLPLTDLPNHLARQHVIAEWATSASDQLYYAYRWQFVPNLGVDLFVLVTKDFLPIDFSVRLFCILGLTAAFIGCRTISRFYSGDGRAYRFAPFLCYGGPVQFGFINFFCGVGFALLLFGLYLRMRNAWPRMLVALLPLGILLLLCHLAAFGIWAIAVGAFELAHPFGQAALRNRLAMAREVLRRELRALSFLLPPLIALVALGPPSLGGSGIRWGTLHEKLEGIAAITLFASPGPELLLLALAVAGFVAAYLVGAIIIRRESAVMFVLMMVVFLLLPRVAGGGGYIDYRVPWAASFFLLSGVVPGRAAARRTGLAIAGFLGVLMAARVGLVAVQWQSWSPQIAGIVTALRALPVGSRLFEGVGDPRSTSVARRPPLEHMAAYAVAYRQAYWNGMFADLSGQILSFRPPYRSGWSDSEPTALVDSVRSIDPIYQYLLVLRPEFVHLSPDLKLRCIAEGPEFRLFLVTVDSADDPRRNCPANPAPTARPSSS